MDNWDLLNLMTAARCTAQTVIDDDWSNSTGGPSKGGALILRLLTPGVSRHALLRGLAAACVAAVRERLEHWLSLRVGIGSRNGWLRLSAVGASMDMPREERRKRTQLMRRTVAEYNICRSAGRMQMDLGRIRQRAALEDWTVGGRER